MLAMLEQPKPARHQVDRTAAFLWYTLSVIPQSQARVCQRARELGIETYAPMSRTPPQLRKFGRERTLDLQWGKVSESRPRVAEAEIRPLMPGYVFVRMPRLDAPFGLFDPRYGSEALRGSLGFISAEQGPERQRWPMPVSEAVIAGIRLRELNGEFDAVRPREASHRKWLKAVRWAKRGVTVQFCGEDCPFAGLFGKIAKIGDQTELIEVEMEAMGRVTTINSPLDWIRRVSFKSS